MHQKCLIINTSTDIQHCMEVCRNHLPTLFLGMLFMPLHFGLWSAFSGQTECLSLHKEKDNREAVLSGRVGQPSIDILAPLPMTDKQSATGAQHCNISITFVLFYLLLGKLVSYLAYNPA